MSVTLATMPITGKRLTPFTQRVLAVLKQYGPMRAGELARRLSIGTAPLGGTLGKLQRAGMIGWSVRDGRYFVR